MSQHSNDSINIMDANIESNVQPMEAVVGQPNGKFRRRGAGEPIHGIVVNTWTHGPTGERRANILVGNGRTDFWPVALGIGQKLYIDSNNYSIVTTVGTILVGVYMGYHAQQLGNWVQISCFDTSNGQASSGGGGGGLTFKAGSRAVTLDLTSNSVNVQTYTHGLSYTPTKLSGFIKLPQQGASPGEQGMLPVSCDMSGNYSGKQTQLDTSGTRLNVGLAQWGLWSITPDNNLNNPDGAEIRWSQERYITVTADATNLYFTRNANGGMSNPSFPNATTARLYFDLE